MKRSFLVAMTALSLGIVFGTVRTAGAQDKMADKKPATATTKKPAAKTGDKKTATKTAVKKAVVKKAAVKKADKKPMGKMDSKTKM